MVHKVYRMGIFPAITGRLHFMTEDWENKKVSEMMRDGKKRDSGTQRKVEGKISKPKEK